MAKAKRGSGKSHLGHKVEKSFGKSRGREVSHYSRTAAAGQVRHEAQQKQKQFGVKPSARRAAVGREHHAENIAAGRKVRPEAMRHEAKKSMCRKSELAPGQEDATVVAEGLIEKAFGKSMSSLDCASGGALTGNRDKGRLGKVSGKRDVKRIARTVGAAEHRRSMPNKVGKKKTESTQSLASAHAKVNKSMAGEEKEKKRRKAGKNTMTFFNELNKSAQAASIGAHHLPDYYATGAVRPVG